MAPLQEVMGDDERAAADAATGPRHRAGASVPASTRPCAERVGAGRDEVVARAIANLLAARVTRPRLVNTSGSAPPPHQPASTP